MRFDRDGYDRSPYDRSGRIAILLSGLGDVHFDGLGDLLVGGVLLTGTGEVHVDGIGDVAEVIHLSGMGGIQVSGSGLFSISAHLSGTGNTQVNGSGNLQHTITLSGSGTVYYGGSGDVYLYGTITFAFSDTLAPGQSVIIDTNDFTVKNNGINDIASFSGEFPIISPGTNIVTYSDSVASRTVRITVTKKDRSI